MRKGAELTRDNETSSKMSLVGQADVKDQESLKLLIDSEDGIMKSGQLPDIASSGGAKALFEVFDTVAPAPKRKAKKEEQPAEQAEPKTALESHGTIGLTIFTLCVLRFSNCVQMPRNARDRMQAVLQESMQARTASMKLTEVEYTGELSQQLLEHANLLEKHYKSLQKSVKTSVTDEGYYGKVYSILDERHAWFVKAQAAANSILSGISKAHGKKKGKEAGEKAKGTDSKTPKGSQA